jgi:hypothetical protein
MSASVEQFETVSKGAAGWTEALPFSQFNPSSGSLTSLGLSLSSTISGGVSIENLGATSASVSIDLPGTVTVMKSGTTLAADYADNHTSKTLGAFDGTINFSGTSGFNTVLNSFTTAGASSSPGLSGFSGTGTVALTGSFTVGTVTEVAMGNILSVTQGEAAAVVGLQYNAPSDTSSSPGANFSPSNPIAWNQGNGSEGSIKGAATTAPQQLVVSDQTTNWDHSFTIQQFNPALGTLEAIQIRFVDDINVGFAVQNLGSFASFVSLVETLDFGFVMPGMTMQALSGGPVINESLALGAYNGTVSFSGTSGYDLSGLQAVGGEGVGAFINDLSAYVGTGDITVEMSASSPSTVTGGGDLALELLTMAGAELDISYIYQPATTTIPLNPTITNTLTKQTTVLQPVAGPFSEVILTDAAPGTVTVTVRPSSIVNGSLEGMAGQPGSLNLVTGVWSVSGTMAQVTQALHDLSFLPTASVAAGGSVTTTFTITLTDSFGGSATNSTTTITQLPNEAVNVGSTIAEVNTALGQQSVPSDPVVNGGTVVIPPVTCFAAGTRIATPDGPVAVERLRPGDRVLTGAGGVKKVRWIGRRRVDCRRHPDPERVWPVRVAPHAFGMDRPRRPLLLSPDHAVFTDGVLIPVRLLLNGASIRQMRPALVTYYHLELLDHDVVLAENLPCESYLETGGRSSFDNAGPVVDLFPGFAGPDKDRAGAIWQAQGFAPLVGSAEILGRVQARLAFQAMMLGYQADGTLPRRTRSSGPRGKVAVNETRAQ